jgi:hypothetical protein
MTDELDELFEWVAALLRARHPGSEGKPSWLEGAEVTADLTPGSRRINIVCGDGSKFVVFGLMTELSAARKEELRRERDEQERQRREAELADPGIKERRLETARRLVESFKGIHESEHTGSFATCRHDLCDTARGLARSMGEGQIDTDDDDHLVH